MGTSPDGSEGRPVDAANDTNARHVTLVCMPWAESHRPSLALSLIKSTLAAAGIRSYVLQANVAFARTLGYVRYEPLASGGFGYFLPEWFFTRAAFPDDFAGDESEAQAVMATATRHDLSSLFGDDYLRVLMDAREKAAIDLCRQVAEQSACSPVVAFSCNVNQLVPAIAAARFVKLLRPKARIVFGGAQCDGPMGDEVLRLAPWVDAVYKGEAEVGVVGLMRWALGWDAEPPLEHVSYRRDDGSLHLARSSAILRDVEALPIPDYDDYFEQVHGATDCQGVTHFVSGLMFESSRGCWWGERHHCTFCGLNRDGMVFRCKRPERLMEEILYLSDRHGQLSFYAADNIISHDYLNSFLPTLRASGLDLEFFYETKSNLKRDHVKLYRDARLRVIQPGIESFSSRVLELMRKGVTGIQNVYLVRLCLEYGVEPKYNILTGFPGEADENYSQQVDWIKHMVHLPYPGGAHDFVLQRFSPMYFDAERFGITNIRAHRGYETLFPPARARLNELAFYFDYDYGGVRGTRESYRKLKKAVRQWSKRWVSGERAPSLTYRCGRTFLVINDDRHPRHRETYVFTGLERKVLLECADPIGKRDLAQRVGADAAALEECLRVFGEMGLVINEGETVLGLAIPRPPPAVNKWSPADREASATKRPTTSESAERLVEA